MLRAGEQLWRSRSQGRRLVWRLPDRKNDGGLRAGDELRELRLTNRGFRLIVGLARFGGSPFGELRTRCGCCFSAETRLFAYAGS
jgi:hypothetical protein